MIHLYILLYILVGELLVLRNPKLEKASKLEVRAHALAVAIFWPTMVIHHAVADSDFGLAELKELYTDIWDSIKSGTV